MPDLPISDASLRLGATFIREIIDGIQKGQVAYGQFSEYVIISELINRMRVPPAPGKPVPSTLKLYSGWYPVTPPQRAELREALPDHWQSTRVGVPMDSGQEIVASAVVPDCVDEAPPPPPPSNKYPKFPLR